MEFIAGKNLITDRLRLLISVMGVTLAVLIIMVILSLYRGFERQATSFVNAVDADLWVMERGATDLTHSYSVVSTEHASGLEEIEGVGAVVPLYVKRTMLSGSGDETDVRLVAFDLPTGTAVLPGVLAPAPGEIVASKLLRRLVGLSPGDQVEAAGLRYRVAEGGSIPGSVISQMAIVSAQDAKASFVLPGYVNYLLVRVEPGARAEDVAAAIEARHPELSGMTRQAFASANRSELTDTFLPIISVLLVIAFLVGAAVLGLTIYTATVEKTREYGVLKAMGASRRQVLRIVLVQALTVGAAGFLLGLPLTLGVNALASELVPEFANLVRWQDVLGVLAAAALMATVASALPAGRVLRVDPASVFRA